MREHETPTLAIVGDEELALEALEEHERAVEWAAMSHEERRAALRSNPALAEEAHAAARREGLIS